MIAEYYRQNLGELRSFVAKRVHNITEAEDIVQDVFLRLLDSDSMLVKLTLPCFVHTVACNIANDHLRHRHIIEHYELFIHQSYTTNSYDALSIYHAREINEWLERGIAFLPRNSREIYIKNIHEGMKPLEISQTLDLDYKYTENHLMSARRYVRDYLRRNIAE